MIRPLRKRHLQIWTLLALLLPSGSIAAYMMVPHKVIDKQVFVINQTPLPVIRSSIDLTNYKINLREDEKGNQQLEWIMKVPLTAPSAFIYYQTNNHWKDIRENQLIGTLGSKGIYRFTLKSDEKNGVDSTYSKTFILYDAIHQKILDKIILTVGKSAI